MFHESEVSKPSMTVPVPVPLPPLPPLPPPPVLAAVMLKLAEVAPASAGRLADSV